MMNHTLHPAVRAFSTERGETASPEEAYSGFNVTHYCGDSPTHVAACREYLCSALHISNDCLFLPRQTHGAQVRRVTSATTAEELEGVDAVTTNECGLCIGVSTADCLPLLLYDPVHHACAAVHAGWRGALAHIAAHTVRAMQAAYGTQPMDLLGVIGPHISLENFEVGDEVYNAFAEAGFPMRDIAQRFPTSGNSNKEKWHISLAAAVSHSLQKAGARAEHLSDCHICTYRNYSRFFSARRLGIQSGRIFTGVMLE